MNLSKFSHSAMFVGAMACSKTEFLLRLLETEYKNHLDQVKNEARVTSLRTFSDQIF